MKLSEGISDIVKLASEVLTSAMLKHSSGPSKNNNKNSNNKNSNNKGKPLGKMRLSFIDNNFRGKVTPVRGSIVCCDLAVVEEHSGVYVGDGKIVHRDGAGHIALVSPETFLERLDGFNNAISVYVSCNGENAAGSEKVAKRALAALSDPRRDGYDLLTKNCHHFCQYCLTGEEHGGLLEFSFDSLERELKKAYKFDNWRVWDR